MAYSAAITDALHPVFLAAAGIVVVAFCLTWLLPELPLRDDLAGARPR